MTGISSVTTTATTGTSGATSARRHDPMSAVVDLLGGSRKEVFSALRSGKSLDDLAKDKGVSHEALTAAIAAGMPADDPDAAARAEQIAGTQGLPQGPGGAAGGAGGPGGAGGHSGGGRGHGGPPPAGAATGAVGGATSTATQDRLDRLSALLGTDSGTLVQQLVDGQSLAGLASAKGVTATQVSSALQRGDLFDAYA